MGQGYDPSHIGLCAHGGQQIAIELGDAALAAECVADKREYCHQDHETADRGLRDRFKRRSAEN
jgi:hypothetical protein